MTNSEVYAILNDIFADVFMISDIKLSSTTTAKDISDWDSIRHLEIIMEVEKKFNFRFTSREIDNLSSVGDLSQIILERRK